MREIKFRAWDGNSIRYDVTGLEHGKENEMDLVFLDGDYHCIVDNIYPDFAVRKAIVMQYTGLKDRNGVEIYEGDILIGDYGEQEKEERVAVKGAVTFHSGVFKCGVYGIRSWSLDEMNGQFEVSWHDENRMYRQHWYYVLENIEIIGNIYENPELLS